jgi:hypothetical protein
MAGISQSAYTLENAIGTIAHDWQGIWIYPAWGSVAVLVIFLVFFKNPAKKVIDQS